MYLTIKFKPHTSRTRPSISEGFVKIQINSEISPRLGRDHFYPENFFYAEGWGNQPTFTPTPPGSGSCWCQCSSGFNTSISREITHKHVTHLKRHLEVSENPHWVTTALHKWPLKVKRKIIPSKKGQMLLCFLPAAEASPHLFPSFFATIQWWIWKRNVNTFNNFILQAVWAIESPFNYHHKRPVEG